MIAFTTDAREAGRLGAPTEVAPGAAAGTFGDPFQLETWIDDFGLPRRIALTLALDPQSHAGKLVLPARTVRVTYHLNAFGDRVTGLHFESQAG